MDADQLHGKFRSINGSEVASMDADYDTFITAPTAPTKNNYTFAGWYKEADFTTLWNFASDKVLSDTMLYANWTPSPYIVNFEANGGSLVTKVNADYDTAITAPTAPTKANYEFVAWYKEDTFTTHGSLYQTKYKAIQRCTRNGRRVSTS